MVIPSRRMRYSIFLHSSQCRTLADFVLLLGQNWTFWNYLSDSFIPLATHSTKWIFSCFINGVLNRSYFYCFFLCCKQHSLCSFFRSLFLIHSQNLSSLNQVFLTNTLCILLFLNLIFLSSVISTFYFPWSTISSFFTDLSTTSELCDTYL